MKIVPNDEARVIEITALGDLLADYGGQNIATDVLRRNGDVQDFMRSVSERVNAADLAAGAGPLLGTPGYPARRAYSLTRAMRAEMERDWGRAPLERRVSDLGTTTSKMAPNGFYVPLGIMARDFNVGTATQAGNLVGSAVETSLIRDPLRNLSALGRLGCRFIYGLSATAHLPRLSPGTQSGNEGPPQWETETSRCVSAFVESSAAPLTPKRIATQLTLSRQALIQSTPELDAFLSQHLLREILRQIEAALLSTDAGTGDSPCGLLVAPGVAVLGGGINGAELSLVHLSQLEALPSYTTGNESENAGYLLNPDTRRYCRQTSFGEVGPFVGRNLLGYKTEVSTYMPGNLTKGTSTDCSALAFSADWSELVIAFYGPGIDVLVDRVTLAAEGKVRITASALVGVGVNNPASFAVMRDARLV